MASSPAAWAMATVNVKKAVKIDFFSIGTKAPGVGQTMSR